MSYYGWHLMVNINDSILYANIPNNKGLYLHEKSMLHCGVIANCLKVRHQNSLPLTKSFSHKSSHNHLRGSVTQSVIFPVSQNSLSPLPIHYMVIQYPQQILRMAFCDLLHTFHKQVTNVSQHVFVIQLWGILTSPLNLSQL